MIAGTCFVVICVAALAALAALVFFTPSIGE